MSATVEDPTAEEPATPRSTATGDETASAFRSWAVIFRRNGAPFQADLTERCAQDADILALAGEARPGQPPSLMFFGAVHSIVLSDPNDPLAPYFGSGSKPLQADEATFAALKDFCRRRRDQIAAIVRNRTVQVTLPRRASLVPPLFGHILRKGAKEPFSLIEVGCSAGLLTVFDRFYFDFGPLGVLGDPAHLRIGVPTFEGASPPIPATMPNICERFGIDLDPIDPTDPAQRLWLEGLLPIDAKEGRRELRSALEARARVPLNTIAGDAVKVVPELLPKLKATACVLHANCLYQWPAALQKTFHEMLLEHSRNRVIYRLGIDFLHEIPGRPARAMLDPSADLWTDMIAVTYRDGHAAWDYLGACDGIGLRAKWVA